MDIGIDPRFTVKVLTAFIREELGKRGFRRAVLGLSGGLDSAVCAVLAARALGPKSVLGLLMPYGESFGPDVKHARRLAAGIGIRTDTVDIKPMVDPYFERYPTDRRVLRGNKMARERMSVLYDYSVREGGLVLGTMSICRAGSLAFVPR